MRKMKNRPNWIDWRVDILEDSINADERYNNLTIDQIIDRLKKFSHLSPENIGGDFEEEELRRRFLKKI